MEVQVTVKFTTDDPEVTESVSTILGHTLPYMADNVSIHFDTQEA
jgi:hypothetical protein